MGGWGMPRGEARFCEQETTTPDCINQAIDKFRLQKNTLSIEGPQIRTHVLVPQIKTLEKSVT